MASTLLPPGSSSPTEGAGADGSASADLPPGTTLDRGRYRIDGVLGRGGFGITYAAEDQRLRRPVAVKELFPDGARRQGPLVVVPEAADAAFAGARARFLREATTLARFGHPGIVRIWGALEEHGTAYLVLERLQGRTLAEELRARRGPFSQAEALDVAEQVAAALAVVHRAGVLHRDVSPANLVRTDDGRVVLIDFGLARPFASDRTMAMTRIVTPGYASPEQYAGTARFGPRSDVYALGATLYRLVTGARLPGARDRVGDDDAVIPAWRLNPSVSRPVSDALGSALALDPDRRPPTVEALLERLGVGPGPGSEPVVGDAPTAVPAAVPGPAVDLSWRPPSAHGPGPGGWPVAEGRTVAAVDEVRDAPGGPSTPVPLGAEPMGEATRPARRRYAAEPHDPVTRRATHPGPSLELPATGPGRGPGPSSPAGSDTSGRAGPLLSAPPSPTGRSGPGVAHRLALLEEGTSGSALGREGDWPDVGPRPVGAPPRGRSWVTVPLGLAAVSLASAQPFAVTVVLALVVAPLLATAGDRLVRPHRSLAWLPGWWTRNLAVGLVRSFAAACVLAVGACLWYGTETFGSLAAAGPWVLRTTGLVAGWVLASSIGRGGLGFRSHVALDAVASHLMPRGRFTAATAVLLITCTGLTAAGAWFRPEAWPLGG